ncbi:hypothetical protein KKB10_01095 [Patescibacteria group bacterium]|nr:hypothetical protein [Patescibacteria group bacterium]MBU1075241.1 hypothetical protein [Patescibacteria group bacterium]MBU1952500.1 hypothetical protein [Patescibacteria group bacterium]
MIRIIKIDVGQSEIAFLAEQMGESSGIWLKDIAPLSVVTIFTQNTEYVFSVIDPDKGEVEITSNGTTITHPHFAQIIGSTFGGSVIRVKWIGIDMCLEVMVYDEANRIITTSSIRRITIFELPPDIIPKPRPIHIPHNLRPWFN